MIVTPKIKNFHVIKEINDILLLAPFHCIKLNRDINKINYIHTLSECKLHLIGFSVINFKKRIKVSAKDKIKVNYIINNSMDKIYGNIYFLNKNDNLIYEIDINKIINSSYLIKLNGFKVLKDKSKLMSYKIISIRKDKIIVQIN